MSSLEEMPQSPFHCVMVSPVMTVDLHCKSTKDYAVSTDSQVIWMTNIPAISPSQSMM